MGAIFLGVGSGSACSLSHVSLWSGVWRQLLSGESSYNIFQYFFAFSLTVSHVLVHQQMSEGSVEILLHFGCLWVATWVVTFCRLLRIVKLKSTKTFNLSHKFVFWGMACGKGSTDLTYLSIFRKMLIQLAILADSYRRSNSLKGSQALQAMS